MHIILLLAVVSGLIWGIVHLQREIRRRKWEKMNTTPLFNISSPRELTAVLLFGLVKCGGDPTSEEKDRLIRLYSDELEYSDKDAPEIYSYASYVVGTDVNFAAKVSKIVAPALDAYSESQKAITLQLLEQFVDGRTSAQDMFFDAVRAELGK